MVLENKNRENTWICPTDCENQLLAGGNFDNPHVGGCAIEDELPNEIENLETDGDYPMCPHYRKYQDR